MEQREVIFSKDVYLFSEAAEILNKRIDTLRKIKQRKQIQAVRGADGKLRITRLELNRYMGIKDDRSN